MDTKNFIKIFAYQFGFETYKLSLDTKISDLGGDSLDNIELIMCIEDEYDVEFVDGIEDHLGRLDTIRDFYNLIKMVKDQDEKFVKISTVVNYLKQKENMNTIQKPVAKKPTTRKPTSTATTKRPANHNKRWKDDDRGVLLYRYAQGIPVSLIAKELGRTKVSILGQLSELNLVQFDKEKNAYYTVPTLIHQF